MQLKQLVGTVSSHRKKVPYTDRKCCYFDFSYIPYEVNFVTISRKLSLNTVNVYSFMMREICSTNDIKDEYYVYRERWYSKESYNKRVSRPWMWINQLRPLRLVQRRLPRTILLSLRKKLLIRKQWLINRMSVQAN